MFRKLATATVLATTALAGLAPAIAHANTANPAPEPASEAGGCRFGHWPAEAQGRIENLGITRPGGFFYSVYEIDWRALDETRQRVADALPGLATTPVGAPGGAFVLKTTSTQ